MDPDDVARLWSPRTRMVVINSPHNPTGAVMSADAIAAIARLAAERGAWLLSDEAYERLIFEGEHLSPASLPGVADAVLTIGCLSKAYAMTGWRLGYVAGPAEAIEAINRVHLYTVTCAVSFVQQGGDCRARWRSDLCRRHAGRVSPSPRPPHQPAERGAGRDRHTAERRVLRLPQRELVRDAVERRRARAGGTGRCRGGARLGVRTGRRGFPAHRLRLFRRRHPRRRGANDEGAGDDSSRQDAGTRVSGEAACDRRGARGRVRPGRQAPIV